MIIEEIVAKLAREMTPNPYTDRAPTIEDIIAVVRIGYGDQAARKIKITIH